jgi:preprotein translocase subunit SecB
MTTPLQLDNHFYTNVFVQALPEFAESDESSRGSSISWKIDVHHPSELGLPWIVELQINIDPSNGKSSPYKIRLTAVGVFVVSDDVPVEKIEALLRINGGSMLYSSSREFLFSITARSPNGPIYLPTIRILPKKETSAKDQDSKTKKSAASKVQEAGEPNKSVKKSSSRKKQGENDN